MGISALHNEVYSDSEFRLDEKFRGFTILNFIQHIYRVSNYILGLIGIIIVGPLLLLLIFTSIIYLWRSKRKLTRDFSKLLYNIKSIDPNQLVEIHLSLEKYCIGLDKQFKRVDVFNKLTITKPLYNQVIAIDQLIKGTERKLKSHLYPNTHAELSDEDKIRLSKTFEGVTDWDDNELDLYEKVYC